MLLSKPVRKKILHRREFVRDHLEVDQSLYLYLYWILWISVENQHIYIIMSFQFLYFYPDDCFTLSKNIYA